MKYERTSIIVYLDWLRVYTYIVFRFQVINTWQFVAGGCRLRSSCATPSALPSRIRGKGQPFRISGFFFFFDRHFYFPAQLVGGFYPQRSSGQAVVTGVVPSPPRCVPSFLSLIGFSMLTACRFSSNVGNSRSRAFRYNNNLLRKKSPYKYAHSRELNPRNCF